MLLKVQWAKARTEFLWVVMILWERPMNSPFTTFNVHIRMVLSWPPERNANFGPFMGARHEIPSLGDDVSEVRRSLMVEWPLCVTVTRRGAYI